MALFMLKSNGYNKPVQFSGTSTMPLFAARHSKKNPSVVPLFVVPLKGLNNNLFIGGWVAIW